MMAPELNMRNARKGIEMRLFKSPDFFVIPLESLCKVRGDTHQRVCPEVQDFEDGPGLRHRLVEFHRGADRQQVGQEDGDRPQEPWGAVRTVRFLVALGPCFVWLVHWGILRLSASSSKDANAAL